MAMSVGLLAFPHLPANQPQVVTYGHYVQQILHYAGLCYQPLSSERWSTRLPDLNILITVGEAELESAEQAAIEDWVRAGGTWISIAGVCGLSQLLGIEPVAPHSAMPWGTGSLASLGECYLAPTVTSHPTMRGIDQPLHGFGGLAAQPTTANVLANVLDKHGRPTDRVGLSVHEVDRGQAIFIGVDVPGTVVRIQQGIAVTRDAVSAPDGSAAVTDQVLKSDDGMVLDWLLDRVTVAGVEGMEAFLCPIADQWRQLLLSCVFHVAQCQRVALPILWYWPERLPAVAHLSFDTDGNDRSSGQRLMEICDELDVCGTWCVIAPGYEPALIEALHQAGHELAMHYDAMSPDRPWSHKNFLAQHAFLTNLFGGRRPVSNKNHYLRWQGDTEFYHWLKEVGIEFDQSKGTSKGGEFGFNFGTCHPFLPLDESGRVLDVLELPTPTQDLEVFAPKAGAGPLLDAVVAAHGVFHLLFHPVHVGVKSEVADAMREAVRHAKGRGLAYWTAAQINAWQRARRAASWTTDQNGNLALTIDKPLTKATLLWLDVGQTPEPAVRDQDSNVKPMRCWGFDFHSVVVDLAEGTHPISHISQFSSGSSAGSVS